MRKHLKADGQQHHAGFVLWSLHERLTRAPVYLIIAHGKFGKVLEAIHSLGITDEKSIGNPKTF